MFKGLDRSVAAPSRASRVRGVGESDARIPKTAEEARVAMVMDKANLAEKFRDALVPESCRYGEAVDWN